MHLRPGGIDIFYIDESHDRNFYVVTAVCVPMLRQVEGRWTFVWNNHWQGARAWRRTLKQALTIPTSKELHAVKLLSGRGNFKFGKYNFDRPKAGAVYRDILKGIDFLPSSAVMSVSANRGKHLYGRDRLDAALYALFQRMRRKCHDSDTNALVFFDQGHPEYRKLYRQAQVYLPTGSRFGKWEDGTSLNLPLDMFVEDGNEKNSRHCHFTQIADLIAYAAFMKMKGESGQLEDWQSRISAHNIYASVPDSILNTKASFTSPRDAIVRLK